MVTGVLALGIAAGVALAQAPAPEPAPEPEPDPAVEEIVVYAELAVQRAREAVVTELEDLGYDDHVVRRGNYVVYRHAAPWKGEVLLHDDGWMRVRRQPMHAVGARVPWARRNSPGAWAGCLIWPWACVRIGGATVGHRLWLNRSSETVAALAPKVQTYGDRIADLHVSWTADQLPDRLMALWELGTPLSGAIDPPPPIPTAMARRRALFEFWASRTDTPWGDAVRDVVEAFVRGVVQPSDHPYTPTELARYSALAGRPFPRPAGEE